MKYWGLVKPADVGVAGGVKGHLLSTPTPSNESIKNDRDIAKTEILKKNELGKDSTEHPKSRLTIDPL